MRGQFNNGGRCDAAQASQVGIRERVLRADKGMMPPIVKILFSCVKIYYLFGRSLRASADLKARFESVYDRHIEEMSV